MPWSLTPEEPDFASVSEFLESVVHTALASVLHSTAVVVEHSRGCTACEGVGREATGVSRQR